MHTATRIANTISPAIIVLREAPLVLKTTQHEVHSSEPITSIPSSSAVIIIHNRAHI